MAERTFLFITFNEKEREAFLNRLECQGERTFVRGNVVTYFHSPYQGSESQMSVLNVIQSVKPDAVVLAGIACGANVKNEKQKFGDVLISKNVIDYDFHKDNNGMTELRGTITPSGDILFHIMRIIGKKNTVWIIIVEISYLPRYC